VFQPAEEDWRWSCSPDQGRCATCDYVKQLSMQGHSQNVTARFFWFHEALYLEHSAIAGACKMTTLKGGPGEEFQASVLSLATSRCSQKHKS
jgi:hypothetical protein